MGQQQNRMEGAVEPEPEQTLCQRYADFVTRLNDYIEPQTLNGQDVAEVNIEFNNEYNSENPVDKGKIREIRNGKLRNPESGTVYDDLNTINYDDESELSELLNMNLNGQNSLAILTYLPDGRLFGQTFNQMPIEQNTLFRPLLRRQPNRLFRSIQCDAEKRCTCIYTQPPSPEIVTVEQPPPTVRAATKIG